MAVFLISSLLAMNFSISITKKLVVATRVKGIHQIAGKGAVLKGLVPNRGSEYTRITCNTKVVIAPIINHLFLNGFILNAVPFKDLAVNR